MEFTVRLRTRARAEVVAEGRQGTEGWGLSQKVSGGPQLLRAPREACCLLHSWSLLLSPRQACQLIPAQHLARSFHFLWPAWDLSHLSTYWRGFLVPWVGGWGGMMKGRIRGCPGRGIPWGPADGNEMKGTDTEPALGESSRVLGRAGLEEPGQEAGKPGFSF